MAMAGLSLLPAVRRFTFHCCCLFSTHSWLTNERNSVIAKLRGCSSGSGFSQLFFACRKDPSQLTCRSVQQGDQFSRRRLQQSQESASQNFNRWQIGQCKNIRLFKPLVI